MREKFLNSSEEEVLYNQCMQVIQNKNFDLLKKIESTITRPDLLIDENISILLYYIYFILLSSEERDIFYNIKFYIYEDLAYLKINEIIDFYNETVINMPDEEKYLWQLSLLILKAYTKNDYIPDINFNFKLIPKINTFIHKTKYKRISAFTLKMMCLWIKEFKQNSTVLSLYDKMYVELNLHNSFCDMPFTLNKNNDEDFDFVEGALDIHTK